MHDVPRSYTRDEYTISTDRARLDVGAIHGFLVESYWATGMRRDALERAILNSLCFGVYHGTQQIGFARAITDLSTYAYLSDVFIVEDYRGRGLSKWLMECILAHPDLQGLRRFALFTRDAARLYTQYGFGPANGRTTYLERRAPGR